MARRAGDGLIAAAVFAAALALYARTLAPSVVALFDDSLEFPLVVHRLAVAHPTGYPLYVLLGKLLAFANPQNPAWALNVLSALAGALAVALVYGVARGLGARRLAAAVGALALAVSPVFWSQATVAEVYTLNAVFIAGLLGLALVWARRPLLPLPPVPRPAATGGPPPPGGALFLPRERGWLRLPAGLRRAARRTYDWYRWYFPAIPPARRLRPNPLLLAGAALFGLSVAHHRTAQLLAVPLLFYCLVVQPRVLTRRALLGPEHPGWPRWRRAIARPGVLLALGLLLPLLLYLYLPLRGSVGSLDGTYGSPGLSFWRWIAAGSYGAFLRANPLARDLDAAFYRGLFWDQFGPLGLALAAVGAIALFRRFKALLLTGLAFGLYLAFALAYRVPDVELFFIPAFLIVAAWIGVGLGHALHLLRPRGPSVPLRRVLVLARLLLVAGVAAQVAAIGAGDYSALDRSQSWIVHDYGRYALQALPAGSTVVGLGGEMTLLRYIQETQGLGRSVQTVIANEEQERLEAVQAGLAAGRPVYVTRPLPGLERDNALVAATGLIDVAGEPEALVRVEAEPDRGPPPAAQPLDLRLMRGLRLVGYDVVEHRAHWQAWARLALWWRSPTGLAVRLKVSARLLNADGQVIAAADAEPVANTYPTTAWRPGTVVADAYEIPLPAGTPPGDYTPLVVVYDFESGEERGRAELARVRLAGNPARPPRAALEAGTGVPSRALFGDVALLGFSPPDPAAAYRPGDRLPLLLLWQARERPAGAVRLSIWLDGGRDYALAETTLGGPYPAERWSAGQAVRQWPVLRLPAGVPAGTYRLKLRLARDGRPVAWGWWLVPGGSDLDLGEVTVAAGG